MNDKIEKVLDKVRPSLQMDGGDVKFIDFNPESGLVRVELQGHCAHCPMSTVTLKQGIEAELKKEIPEITAVISI